MTRAPALPLVPAPLAGDRFEVFRVGIFDAKDVTVFANQDRSFAFLDPQPSIDYSTYMPRQAKLGLSAYKNTLSVIDRRFGKIGHLLPAQGTVLEIGAAEGNFLKRAHEERPNLQYVAVEPDQNTAAARAELRWLTSYGDLDAAAAAGLKADFICLFHVFEHIAKPKDFLAAIRKVLAPGGRVVIEVPSLDDPLLTVYALPAYEAFYFQNQHPFVYTGRSLARVLTDNGFKVREILPYQRYGLENHMAWMRHGKPGGDAGFADVVSSIESGYRAALESRGTADTVFVVGQTA